MWSHLCSRRLLIALPCAWSHDRALGACARCSPAFPTRHCQALLAVAGDPQLWLLVFLSMMPMLCCNALPDPRGGGTPQEARLVQSQRWSATEQPK